MSSYNLELAKVKTNEAVEGARSASGHRVAFENYTVFEQPKVNE